MIRDSVSIPSLQEPPATGKGFHLHFTADQPLKTDRKNISYDQHPDHQFRIDTTGDPPSTNNAAQARCEAGTDRAQ